MSADGDARCQARGQVLAGTADLLGGSGQELLQALPRLIGAAFGSFGWDWNGFYGLRADACLHLSFAFGPPVCSQIEASGGALTSGMCFDSLDLYPRPAGAHTKR